MGLDGSLVWQQTVGTAPISHEDIVDEIRRDIRKLGGEFSDCCVGTARDPRGPFFHSRLAAELGDGPIYREAYTVAAARAPQHHLVHGWGLQSDPNAAPGRGKIAFAYRKTAPAHPETRSVHPTFRKLAA
jgi:hypothetical protein